MPSISQSPHDLANISEVPSLTDQDLLDEVGLPEHIPQPHQPVAQSRSPNLWPPTLIIDLAMGLEHTDDILTKHGMTERELDRLMEVPSFRRELSTQIREQHENGLTFAKKAATQAETYLLTLDEIVNDAQIPASTRLAAIQSIVKWGGLEPKENNNAIMTGNTINLQINYTS